jgi:hypothetical protein
MVSIPTNDGFRVHSVNTRSATRASPPMTMSFSTPPQDRSRDDPPSPPPQPPPSPASWNRLHSVRCVTRRHPSILTLRQAGRPCAVGHLNPGVNDVSAGGCITFVTFVATKMPFDRWDICHHASPHLLLTSAPTRLEFGHLSFWYRGVIGVIFAQSGRRERTLPVGSHCNVSLGCTRTFGVMTFKVAVQKA